MTERPIALAAGGTGGHLFPAEALAQELKRRGWRVLLVTDSRGARYAEDFPADARFEISAASPSIGGIVAKTTAAFSIAGGLAVALREFGRRKPAAAVGFGGYPSTPAMLAAALRGVPYGVHEQNGVLGRANRLVVGKARFVAHAFPVLDRLPAKARAKAREVGNPVRDAVAALEGAAFTPPAANGPINLLVFGGSQGASIFSRTLAKTIPALPEEIRRRLSIVHQVREDDLADMRRVYQEAGVIHKAAPFFPDLPQRIADAHLVIARAGASTVTELSVIGRPSILVPLAIAMDDHQAGNARVLSEAGAAIVLPEKALTDEGLRGALEPLLTAPERLAQMAAAARGCVKRGAAAALADLVEGIAWPDNARKDM